MSTHTPEAGGAEFPIPIFPYSYGLIEAQTPQSLDPRSEGQRESHPVLQSELLF